MLASAKRNWPSFARLNVSNSKAENVVKPPSTPTIRPIRYSSNQDRPGECSRKEADHQAAKQIDRERSQWKTAVGDPVNPTLQCVAQHRTEAAADADQQPFGHFRTLTREAKRRRAVIFAVVQQTGKPGCSRATNVTQYALTWHNESKHIRPLNISFT
jgi:hypothetical protein